MHIDLDGAWPRDAVDTYVDCRAWGPRLRYSATVDGVDEFYEFIRERLGKFTLFGSGDYHHLSALWLRRLEQPVTLVTFDNHPDWDIRPPRWCCGTWINRALELPNVRKAAIWGCGNYELNWPSNLFVNRPALRAGRLEVWPWTERLKESGRKRWPGMTREDWREKFSAFARRVAGEDLYVTVDLDCLDSAESMTNWENGLFKAEDIVWALDELRSQARIVGGDLCGGYSRPTYERLKQRIESTLDHPPLREVTDAEIAERNNQTMRLIWNHLTNGQTGDEVAVAPPPARESEGHPPLPTIPVSPPVKQRPARTFSRRVSMLAILASAVLTTIAEVCLKIGAAATAKHATVLPWLGLSGLESKWVWFGILFTILSFLTWIRALRGVPLSIAFTCSNIVYVFVPLCCWLILGEAISPRRWAGIALLILGLLLMTKPVAELNKKLDDAL